MIDTVYVEAGVEDHPRARRLLDRFSEARVISCDRYTEVFNPAAQSFHLQKQRPALILARKRDSLVLPAPDGFGIGDGPAFYFSHLLNCPYDCRYCFLQGMFRSAHYVLFVNYEAFEAAIDQRLAAHASPAPDNSPADRAGPPQRANRTSAFFFSGYDCDSLALESVTGFVDHFLPVFAARPNAVLEIRTKSVAIRPLLAAQPPDNVVVAFSLTPAAVAVVVEHGAPAAGRRIAAAAELAARGWRIGLRLDPLIWYDGWRDGYGELIDQLAAAIPAEAVHSASIGPMRFPPDMFRRIARMYPEDELLAGPLERNEAFVSYAPQREAALTEYVGSRLEQAFPHAGVFSCTPVPA